MRLRAPFNRIRYYLQGGVYYAALSALVGIGHRDWCFMLIQEGKMRGTNRNLSVTVPVA
jgi:hypothetical protein